MTAAIAVRELSHRYDGDSPFLAVDGMDLAVGDGEFVSLLGPSGCGKTTVLRAVAGLLSPTAGGMQVLGGEPAAATARHALGLVSQEPGLLPWRSVRSNVALAGELAGVDVDVPSLLERVGIAGFADYYPRALSGGMRQRVALARAFAHRPAVLLMDEPFGALDELSREELCYELLRIWERDRVSVLFVTHSVREAVLLSDRVVVMSRAPGRAVADVNVPLPRPRRPDMEELPAFVSCVREIRRSLATPAQVAS
jgi:NitT/TauT family transport system ATP-binding protein